MNTTHSPAQDGNVRPVDEAALRQLSILRHSLGLSESGEGQAYRNHFVTAPDSMDFDNCRALVASGLMNERPGNAISGGDNTRIFSVTPAGEAFVKEHQPPKKKLTRGQQRYRAWVRADGHMTFGQWLKSPRPS